MSSLNSIKDLDLHAESLGIGGYLAADQDEKSYKNRMQKRKEIQDKRLEERNKEKGLIVIFTGNGKGKTTAALGMALRVIGHKKSVAVIQFIKGGWESGETKALQGFDKLLEFHTLGEGFTWESQDRQRDQLLIEKAWKKSLRYLEDPKFKLVILDEINVAMKLGYINHSQVLTGIKSRPKLTHVALTGRGAPQELIDQADLVTEMKLVHHPFKEQGVKAQKGIEY